MRRAHEHQTPAGSVSELKRKVAEAIDDSSQFFTKYQLAEASAPRTKWKEWVTEDVDRGGKRAHQATKPPHDWTPEIAKHKNGVVSSHPMAVLESEREKFAQLWQTT